MYRSASAGVAARRSARASERPLRGLASAAGSTFGARRVPGCTAGRVQVSRSVMVRLKTGAPGLESTGSAKK